MRESALERVTDALIAAGSSERLGNWNCPGAAHQRGDVKPSLSVTQGVTGAALYCHMGCSTEDIVSTLGLKMSDLFDEELESREVARYLYRDIDGKVLFAKIRFEPKSFGIQHPVAGGWEWGLGGVKPVLYRLPELCEAVREGKTVYVVEGEKDADRLAREGFTATCNFDGAGPHKWRDEYNRYFAGASVVIVADKDEPGEAHAAAVKAGLSGHARSAVIMHPAAGKDVSDHLDAGYPVSALVPVVSGIASKYKPVNWADAFKRQPEETDWLFPPILEAGTVNALFGPPGIGKSLITLEIAVTLVREGRRVMYVDDENRIEDTVDRLQAFGVTHDELADLVMYSFAGLPPLDTPAGGEHLAALADHNDPALVVLDTTTRMVEGDENSATTFLQLYRCSLVPLKQRGITVLRLDHPGKEGSKGQRGSSAKAGDVDTIWKIYCEQGDMIVLEREKSRSGHGEGWISVRREKQPVLRHDWYALDKMPVTPQIVEWARRFDRWGIPRDAGRPTLRNAVKERVANEDKISTTLLALVAKFRKAQLSAELSGQPGTAQEEAPF